VESINVSLNDKISAGKILMKLKDVNYSDDYVNLLELREELTKKIEKAKEYKAGYVITAPFDCIVNELTVKEGDSVVAGTPFCKMLDTSAFQVVLGIDELDIQGIEQGQKVEITVDAIENEIYDGEVSSVSLSGENTNGVASYQVSVMVNEAKGLLPGMSANGKITIDKKTDALLVPIDAVSTVNNEKKVTVVKDDNTTEERTVKLGLVNNSSAEVLEGLEEGEQVQLIVKIQDIYSQMGITVEE
jgi:RND family efflux transporter, MFP subunit